MHRATNMKAEIVNQEHCIFHTLKHGSDVTSGTAPFIAAFVTGMASVDATVRACSDCADALDIAIKWHNERI